MDSQTFFNIIIFGLMGVSVILLIVGLSKKKKSDVDEDNFNETSRRNGARSSRNQRGPQPPQRIFTREELMSLGPNYTSDESGNVFVINNDGSVTIVGQLATQQTPSPMQPPTSYYSSYSSPEYNALIEGGIMDMMPATWAYFLPTLRDGDPVRISIKSESMALGGVAPLDIEDMEEIDIIMFFNDTSPDMTKNMLQSMAAGDPQFILLLPASVHEYIMSLGAAALLRRTFPEALVHISSPAVFGAYGAALQMGGLDRPTTTGFTFGGQYCNISSVDSVFRVTGINNNAPVVHSNPESDLQLIGIGAFVYHAMIFLETIEAPLVDMMAYPIELYKFENGQLVQRLTLIQPGISVPVAGRQPAIACSPATQLSLFVGDIVLLENILANTFPELTGYSQISVTAEIDPDPRLSFLLRVTTPMGERTIDIGALIG